MTLQEMLAESAAKLKNTGMEEAESEAAFLIAAILDMKKSLLPLHFSRNIKPQEIKKIRQAVKRRLKLEPAALILGYKYFFEDRFLVGRKTLIPRADTEHLLYAVQESGRKFLKILDIGSGTGALAISLSRLFPESEITALDIEVSVLKKNIHLTCVKNVKAIKADFFRWKPAPDIRYDLVISNPPYLSNEDFKLLHRESRLFEPVSAFSGGEDGLSFYRAIAVFSVERLVKDGMLVLEVDHKFPEVEKIAVESGFKDIQIRKDYGGKERVLTALQY